MPLHDFYKKSEAKTDSIVRALGWRLQRLADSPITLALLVVAAISIVVLAFALTA